MGTHWVPIHFNKTLDLVCIENTINSEHYVDVLQNDLLSNAEMMAVSSWVFRMTMAAVHMSQITNNVLDVIDVYVLDLSAK